MTVYHFTSHAQVMTNIMFYTEKYKSIYVPYATNMYSARKSYLTQFVFTQLTQTHAWSISYRSHQATYKDQILVHMYVHILSYAIYHDVKL